MRNTGRIKDRSVVHTIVSVVAIVMVIALSTARSSAATDIQQLNGLLGTDTSYFPISVWLQSPNNFQAYANAGINLINNGDYAVDNTFMQAAQTAGLGVIENNQTSGLASSYKGLIKAWGQVDEPDNAQSNGSGGYDPCISPSTIVTNYNNLRSKDTTRPVVINFGQGASYTTWVGRGTCTGNTAMYAQYAAGADIVSFDIYPINGGYPLTYVSDGVDNLRQWTNDTKPVWAYIETTNIDSGGSGPTDAQIRAETWLALTHGARGIQYFAHIFSPTFIEAGTLSNGSINGIRTTNAQIKSLAPQLNSPTITNGASVSSSFRVDKIVKKTGTDTYVFAVTPATTGGNATFTIPGASSGTVTVLNENRTITMQNGSFSDTFGAYGVHLYKISGTGGGGATYHAADLDTLIAHYGTTSSNGDLDSSGTVNAYDLSRLLADYTP